MNQLSIDSKQGQWNPNQGDHMFKEANVPDSNIARSPNAADQVRPVVSKRSRARKLAVVTLAAITLIPSVGCNLRNLAVRQAVMISYRDMVWAKRAYNLRYGNSNRPYGEHFQNGFCTGYSDVCNGGDGYVPAMPPADYRGYQYQSADGVQCVNAWFEGYPAGVAAARKEKVGNYNDILISKMIDTAVTQEKNVKHALPADVPVVNPAGEQNVAPPVPSVASNYLPYDGQTQYESPAYGPAPNSRIVSEMDFEESLQSPAPPMAIGSGLNPEANNVPLPMSVRSANYESTRRTR